MQRPFQIRRCSVSVALFLGLYMTQFIAFTTVRAADSASLTVRIVGARNAKGTIRAAVFRDAKAFPNNASEAVQTQAADIDPQTLSATIVFTNLPEGIYAVSVFHDENMNRKLDKNFMGIPKEGYGASKNPKKGMGPPSFEETKFQLSGTMQTLEIKLMY